LYCCVFVAGSFRVQRKQGELCILLSFAESFVSRLWLVNRKTHDTPSVFLLRESEESAEPLERRVE
jgi:hypothetical protein